MKILYLITRAERGGAQVHLADLIGAIKPRAEIVVASGEQGYLADVCHDYKVPFHQLHHLVQPIRPIEDARALSEIHSLIQTVQPDLVHVHTSKAGLLGRMAAAFAGVPCVFTAHTWSFAEGIGGLQKVVALPCEWAAGRLPGQIITVSESNRKRALRYGIVRPDKITTVWNGVPDTYRRADPGRDRVPTLTMVARFVPQKDHQTLLQAASRIHSPFHLTLIGDGPTLPAMQREAVRLGLAGRVVFPGARNDVDIALADSDVFVLSTNWEGFPLTIIEAMRAGLPVVASDVDGVREAVLEGETGFVVPRGNVERLESRLREVIGDRSIRRSMGAAGRRLYEAELTLENMTRKTWSVYQNAILCAGAQVDRDAIPAEGTRS